MMVRVDQLQQQVIETQRAEALALFQANQAGRTAATQIAALVLTVMGVALATGVSAHTDAVAIAVPPVVLVLVAYMFQQYSDVAVTGAARATLERQIAGELGSHALIYEYAVANVRKSRGLVGSLRILQLLTGLFLVVLVGAGVYVAALGQPLWAEIAFGLGTSVGLIACALSYRDMLRSGSIAARAIDEALASDHVYEMAETGPQRRPQSRGAELVTERPRDVFISYAREDTALARRLAAELEREGLSVWLDSFAIMPGERVQDSIGRAVAAASLFVLLVSGAPSEWVRHEWSLLLARTWEDPGVRIVPVVIDDAELPTFLAGVHALHVRSTELDDLTAISSRLLSGVSSTIEEPSDLAMEHRSRLEAIRARGIRASEGA
jgi:TIR domain